jgi:putative transposase
MNRCTVLAGLVWLGAASAAPPEAPAPRARDLGVPFDGTPGPNNAITDVSGVEVGFKTLISGDGPLVRGPNQVWSWDITWLATTVRGLYLHLYLVLDVWSRRIVGWCIAERGSAEIAAELITHACREGNFDPKGLVLHSDNGKPMRASTLIATLQWLGVVPSFSRPHVSDDNPYSEALFRTLKHTPAYPRQPFESLAGAQRWMTNFAAWYNGEHRHSAIRYVTPNERHYGREKEILARRQRLYERARQTYPGRWTGATRNWAPVHLVTLNPAGISEVVNT